MHDLIVSETAARPVKVIIGEVSSGRENVNNIKVKFIVGYVN